MTNFSPPEGRLLSQEQRSTRREILSIERGCLKRYTKHFLYYTPYYVYIYIYIICSPVQKILSQHIQQHSTKVHITSKSIETPCTQDTAATRKKKRKREIARNFAVVIWWDENTRCEKNDAVRGAYLGNRISRHARDRVEKDAKRSSRFSSPCSNSNSKREIVVLRLIVAKKKKEKIVAEETFSNRFSFIINRGIGSNEKHSGRRSPVWKSFHRILNCPLSSFFLSSWFSVASTRRRWARIGTAATSVAGSATSLWPGNATCWGTSTLTASSATRAYSRMGARSATKSSVSIPRYDTLYSSTTR